MQLTNTLDRYGLVAIILHWVMAILIIGLLGMGIYMTPLPLSLQKLKLYGWHKEYGYLVLLMAVGRLSWRLVTITPYLSLPTLEKIAARVVHWLFYFCMFAMPITGWLVTSAAGLPASFFGIFTVPALVVPDEGMRVIYTLIHQWMGYGLIALICLHTGAALKHHFINKDHILRRMISWK